MPPPFISPLKDSLGLNIQHIVSTAIVVGGIVVRVVVLAKSRLRPECPQIIFWQRVKVFRFPSESRFGSGGVHFTSRVYYTARATLVVGLFAAHFASLRDGVVGAERLQVIIPVAARVTVASSVLCFGGEVTAHFARGIAGLSNWAGIPMGNIWVAVRPISRSATAEEARQWHILRVSDVPGFGPVVPWIAPASGVSTVRRDRITCDTAYGAISTVGMTVRGTSTTILRRGNITRLDKLAVGRTSAVSVDFDFGGHLLSRGRDTTN